MAVRSGDAGNNTFSGSDSPDTLFGLDGNDRLSGLGAADTLYGGNGNDRLVGQAGEDLMLGEEGNDTLGGADGADSALGGNGSDVLWGGNDSDFLDGQAGNDSLYGDAGADTLWGGGGDDTLVGHGDDDMFRGGMGNDSADGGNGNDTYYAKGLSGDFSWTTAAGVTTLVDLRPDRDSDQGTDALVGIELVQFDDRTVEIGTVVGNPPPGPIEDQDTTPDQVAENAANGTAVGITAFAPDESPGVSYTLTNSADGRFAISAGGIVTVLDGSRLDHESAAQHLITVRATDAVGAWDERSFTIGVTDLNEAPGAASDANAAANTVSTTAANGATVGVTARAVDPDSDQLTYSLVDASGDPLVGGPFAIDALTGVITVADATGLAEGPVTLRVRATDPEDLRAATDAQFTIQVTNGTPSNRPPGPIADSQPGVANAVTEDAAAGTAVGLTATALDPDNDGIIWSLANDAGGRFSITAEGVVRVANSAPLDHEQGAQHTITVRASDGRGGVTEQAFTIDVTDVNEAPANVRDTDSAANLVAVNAGNGTYVGIDLDADDPESASLSWALTDNAEGRFQINATTGRITVANGSLLDAGSYEVTARAGDGELFTPTRTFTIDVDSPSQFRVNTFTTDMQEARGDHGGSAIAALSTGGFIVVWDSESQESEFDLGGIYAQRYNAAGGRVGEEFHINTVATNTQDHASVIALNGGRFVATWESNDSSNFDIGYRVFEADGTVSVGDRDAHSSGGGNNNQLYSAGTSLGASGFVLTWSSLATNLSGTAHDDTSGFGVYARRFDLNGTAIGNQFRVSDDTAGDQKYSTAATLGSGEFIIAWSDAQSATTSSTDIHLQRYTSAGVEQGSEIVVNSTTAGLQSFASVAALDGGGFVVTWTGLNQAGGSSNDIYMQRFNATGGRLGGEERVNDSISGSQTNSSVTALDGGGFLVTWQSSTGDGSQGAILGQRYTATGAELGDNFVVNPETTGNQRDPHLATLTGDQVVAIWSGSGPGDSIGSTGGGVFGRYFDELTS